MAPVVRRLYALAARLRAAWCVVVEGDAASALRALDLGVIMGGPMHQGPTFLLIAALQTDADRGTCAAEGDLPVDTAGAC